MDHRRCEGSKPDGRDDDRSARFTRAWPERAQQPKYNLCLSKSQPVCDPLRMAAKPTTDACPNGHLVVRHMDGVSQIPPLNALDHLWRKCFRPTDIPPNDPIVRLAWKAPVSDGRGQGYAASIIQKLPLRGLERRHHFGATTAAAKVGRGRKPLRNIQFSSFQSVWQHFDLNWLQFSYGAHSVATVPVESENPA